MQVEEVILELQKIYPQIVLDPIWVETPGDRDRTASLKSMGKTDFFTRDLDEMLNQGKIQIAIHSAKDLPDPLPEKLALFALTKGVDSRDSLVLREGDSLKTLKENAKIGVSSERREEMVQQLREDFVCIEIRGTIGERLSQLQRGKVDGLIMAEAAIIRLKLQHLNRIILPWDATPLQGRLAIIGRSDDFEMSRIFSKLNAE